MNPDGLVEKQVTDDGGIFICQHLSKLIILHIDDKTMRGMPVDDDICTVVLG